ncbi:MAG: STAS domain-containing protein [Planctomycetota bacterium]|jgi:anti-sigma B factor antagonist
MADPDRIDIRHESRPDGLVLTPSGDVDLLRASSLRAALMQAIEGRPGRLVVDMHEVDYMDSSGVATLIEAMQAARESGVGFALCSLNEQVLTTLQITRLDSVFTIMDTPDDEAVA